MIDTVFLDMDDVLNRFTHHILNEKYGLGIDIQNNWPLPGERDIIKVYNMFTGDNLGADEFFQKLTHEDWGAAEPVEQFDEILDFAYSISNNVAILTAGLMHEPCATGKQAWVKKFLPKKLQDKCIVCQHKGLCASPTKLLIDDADQNVDAFIKSGGVAITFPQPWNRASNFVHHKMDFVRKVFDAKVNKRLDCSSTSSCCDTYVGNDVF